MRKMKGGVYILIAVILIIILIAFAFPDWAKKITGRLTEQSVIMNISVGVPQIYWVMNETLEAYNGPTAANSNTNVTVNFSVYNIAEIGVIDNSTAVVNITMDGASLAQRFNSTCLQVDATDTHANYSCKVQMWWWDSWGVWNISAWIEDTSGNAGKNVTNVTMFMGGTKGFEQGPSIITWSGLTAGDTNQSSTLDLILNNTGNVEINNTGMGSGKGNISVNSTPLLGESNADYGLWPGNFSVSYTSGSNADCWANNMSNSTYIGLDVANLTAGNYTGWKDNETGQEVLYFCLGVAGSELTSQPYSTWHDTLGAWTIKIT